MKKINKGLYKYTLFYFILSSFFLTSFIYYPYYSLFSFPFYFFYFFLCFSFTSYTIKNMVYNFDFPFNKIRGHRYVLQIFNCQPKQNAALSNQKQIARKILRTWTPPRFHQRRSWQLELGRQVSGYNFETHTSLFMYC